jgi:hypothetical protein
MNTQILLVKKLNKGHMLNKLHHLMDTLKQRTHFANIYGNSDDYGANIDKFIFSKIYITI